MLVDIKEDRLDLFLDRLGAKTGLNLRYLLLNGNWVSLRFLTVSISGFLLSFFFAKFGTKELLGQYQLVLSTLSIVSLFSFLGLNSAAMEAVVQGREAGVLKVAKLIFGYSWIGFPILVFLGLYYVIFRQEFLLGEMLIFSAFLFPFYYATSSWNVFYEGKQLFKESSLRIISLNVILAVSLIISILSGLNAFWLLGIYLFINILFQGKFLLTIARKIQDRTNDYIDKKFGIAVSFQKFASGLSSTLPPFVISFFFGIEPLAIYYIAYYVVSALSSFMNNIFSLYLPILFRNIALDHRKILMNSLFVGVASWVLFLAFLKFFFIPIYGEGYRESLELAFRTSLLLFLIPFHVYLVGFFSTQRKNSLLIAIFFLANLAGLISLFVTSSFGYLTSVSVYLYVLEIITTIPLLVYYFRLTLIKKI